MSNKIERIKELIKAISDATIKLNLNVDLLPEGPLLAGENRFVEKLSIRILNDVEEVHHFAVMAGDLPYMQKLGTILERYKEVRKDDVGG